MITSPKNFVFGQVLFSSACMCLCVCVCLSVCKCLYQLSQKVFDRFWWNLAGWCIMIISWFFSDHLLDRLTVLAIGCLTNQDKNTNKNDWLDFHTFILFHFIIFTKFEWRSFSKCGKMSVTFINTNNKQTEKQRKAKIFSGQAVRSFALVFPEAAGLAWGIPVSALRRASLIMSDFGILRSLNTPNNSSIPLGGLLVFFFRDKSLSKPTIFEFSTVFPSTMSWSLSSQLIPGRLSMASARLVPPLIKDSGNVALSYENPQCFCN